MLSVFDFTHLIVVFTNCNDRIFHKVQEAHEKKLHNLRYF